MFVWNWSEHHLQKCFSLEGSTVFGWWKQHVVKQWTSLRLPNDNWSFSAQILWGGNKIWVFMSFDVQSIFCLFLFQRIKSLSLKLKFFFSPLVPIQLQMTSPMSSPCPPHLHHPFPRLLPSCPPPPPPSLTPIPLLTLSHQVTCAWRLLPLITITISCRLKSSGSGPTTVSWFWNNF